GDILLTATNALGTLNLGGNNTLNATNVTVPTASTLTVNGPGKLNVSGTTSISDNAVMRFGTNATHVTHTMGGLSITTSTNTGGLLDLGNSFLITNNALTSETQLRQYLHNGYN